MTEEKYLVVEHQRGEQVLTFDDAVIVPIETLNDEVKRLALVDGDYEALFNSSFPVIPLKRIFKLLEEHKLLEPLLEECRDNAMGLGYGKGRLGPPDDEPDKDYSGWTIGEQGVLIMMGVDGNLVGQIDEDTKESDDRIFSAFVQGEERRKSETFSSLPDAISWCESTEVE